MSIIPSIILSVALSCGSYGCGAVRSESVKSLRDALCAYSVKACTKDNCASIEEFLNNYFKPSEGGSCGSVTPKPTDVPVVSPTPAPTKVPVVTPVPTDVPVVTPKPTATVEPEVTAEPTATPAPTPSVTKAPSTDEASYAYQVIELVNDERAKYGLSPLSGDAVLMDAAQKRAAETVKSTVLSEYGVTYRAAGENIAYGQKTPQQVVDAWMNSSGHRANILNASYTKIGVGCYKNGSTYYWSQLFIG